MLGGFAVRALDSVVRIEFDPRTDSALRQAVADQWQDLAVDGPAAADAVVTVASADGQPATTRNRVSEEPIESLGARLAGRVTLAALRRLSGRAFLFHAAAIALDDGRVIGFVGPSGRGKTTAVAELGRTFRYVTDEALAIDPGGTVLAYPKPLLIGRKPGPKRAISASALGLRLVDEKPLRLAALVMLDRRPGLHGAEVSTVDTAEALTDLARESSQLARLESPLVRLSELVASTGGVRRVSYSEATTLAGVIDEILTTVREVEVEPPESKRAPAAGAQPRPRTYSRSRYVDSVVADGRLVVLVEGKVSVLSGLAAAVWAAADGSTEDELIDEAVALFPPADDIDAAAVVRSAIADLVRARLLIAASMG